MKCHNCKNNLYIENGMYVCKNCGYTESIHHKRNTDVFICCVQVNPQGSPTIDSMIAHDLYTKLKQLNIDVFYSRDSLTEYPESDRKAAFDAAIESASVIIITGSGKSNFDYILNSHGPRIKGKAVLPVYTTMDEADITGIPEMFPPVNYDNPKAIDYICKDLSDVLNLLESRELAPTEETRKRKKKKTIVVTSAIIGFILAVLITLFFIFIAPKIINEKKYDKAHSLEKEGKYIQAIDTYYKLGNYKDSVDLLGRIYTKYDGFYSDDEKMVELDLEIINRVARIKINEHYGNKVINAKTTGNMVNNVAEFEYTDSSGISGKGTVELYDDHIVLKIKSEASGKYCISSGTVTFPFDKSSASSDNPEPQAEKITNKKLIGWLNDGVTKSDIENMGYTLTKEESDQPTYYMTAERYAIDNTDIVIEFMVESGNSVNNTKLFSVIAPADFLSPEKVGENCLPFEESGIVYWPGECIFWGDDSHWDTELPSSSIRKTTPLTVVTKDSYNRVGQWDTLLENVTQRCIGESVGNRNFVVEKENDESYLVSCKDGSGFEYYIVDKATYDSKYIAMLIPEDDETSGELWKKNGDLFPDFSEESSDTDKFYRVRKSADDSSSQLGAFKDLENAKVLADSHKGEGYKVFDEDGIMVYEP